MRIALHCGVDPENLGLAYDRSWSDQTRLRNVLRSHPLLRDKIFPEKTSAATWDAGLQNFVSSGEHVILSGSLESNRSSSGPFFKVSLNPLKFELPHRLNRRFGSDRFLEILIPAPSKSLSESSADHLIQWLIKPHFFLGRKWSPFFIRKADPKKRAKVEVFGPEPKLEYMERVYLFAEDGNEFRRRVGDEYPPKGEDVDSHTELSRPDMLDWLLQPRENEKQPYLKLFSRIALGMSPIFLFWRTSR